MASDNADPCKIHAEDGKMFTLIGGVKTPLNHTTESLSATKAMAKKMGKDWDDEDTADPDLNAKKKASARRAPPMHIPSLPPLAQCEADAGGRFDEEESLRKTFGVLTSDRNSDSYKTGRTNYVQAARARFIKENPTV
jgi:hypothetical protein